MFSSITKQTLLDFEGELACILWTSGCDMSCDYCYNIELATGRGKKLPLEDVKNFLISRKGFLTGVVLCGGEPTIHGSSLLSFVDFCKELGYKVKLDTNGYALPKFIPKVDYIALDYKSEKSLDYIEPLKNSGISYEMRMTVHPKYQSEEEIINIINSCALAGYSKIFYLQYFQDFETLGNLEYRNGAEYDENIIIKNSKIKVEFRGKK